MVRAAEGRGCGEEGEEEGVALSRRSLRVEPGCAGQRLDQFIAGKEPSLSRAQIQRLIKEGHARLGGQRSKPGQRVRTGDEVEIEIPAREPSGLTPEEMPLNILHEDDWLLVLDKAAGVAVHPGAGRPSGTLANALLGHWREFGKMGDGVRPGIVHRLDKGTSGLMVVAKTEAALRHLTGQLARRELERRYLAVVWGEPKKDGFRVDMPIGRHPIHRQKMAAAGFRRREAVTEFAALERHGEMSVLECKLVTGRTHQIRVHCQWIGHSVVGDRDYGGVRRSAWRALPEEVARALEGLASQALHAYRLRFVHPETGGEMAFVSRPRSEMLELLRGLGSGLCAQWEGEGGVEG